ncbi:MAG TPA: lipid-A-disaccharide synthase [Gemmatimonadaceae bacterium]|nr:lipid-A-disaccharide synthase [Gemmatimonadaceae bacterium]
MREILFVAGEASGDLHAAGVAAAIRRREPDRPMAGIGGSRMRDAGVTLIEDVERMAVMGFVEVIRHIPRHWLLLRDLRRRLDRQQTGLITLIDYPGFNMRVAARARALGVPVLYYITPQVWAWGAGRLAKLSRLITRAAVILPFEEPLLRQHGIDATFVGHPLLDRAKSMPDRQAARRALGLADDARVLALFPGSREQEIARHLDDFVAVGRELQRRVRGLHVVVSVAPGIELDGSACPFPAVRGASFDVLRAADAAFCKSGTSTLEAAVAGCPLALGYRTNRVTYAIASRVVKVPWIGLVNVVAGRLVAPEFVQEQLVPVRVADALEPLLHDGDPRRRMLDDLAEVRARLGSPGAADRVAEMAIGMAR